MQTPLSRYLKGSITRKKRSKRIPLWNRRLQKSRPQLNTAVSDGEPNRQAEIEAALNNLEDARIYRFDMEEQFEDHVGMYMRHLNGCTRLSKPGQPP